MKFNSFLFEKELTLQFNKELQPDIWEKVKDKYSLKEDVRKKLLEIADVWIDFAHIPFKNVKNVLFTGSLANYNYTKLSDIDLHVLVDYDSISKDFEFLYDYFKDKKAIWAENHDITIKGFPVEMYAQPMSEKPHTNQGVYSVSSNKWIKEPKPIEIDIEGDAVFQKKLDSFKEQIDDFVSGKGTVKTIDKFKEKIRKMRNSAIAKSGEFSQENLIFKSLRNLGYLEKLSDYHKEVIDRGLSLEDILPSKEILKAKNLKNRANRLLEGKAPETHLGNEHEEDIDYSKLDINQKIAISKKDVDTLITKYPMFKMAISDSITKCGDKDVTLLRLIDCYNLYLRHDDKHSFIMKVPHPDYTKTYIDGKQLYINTEAFKTIIDTLGYRYWWLNQSYLYLRKEPCNGDNDLSSTGSFKKVRGL